MKLRLFQIDAFTDRLFHGNPAGVCPLPEWLPDETLQKIAMENNQAETAFYVRERDGFRLRWFTPAVEVDLCGHATLAAAHVLFNFDGFAGPRIEFDSRSGPLTVRREGDLLTLDFPADTFAPAETPRELIQALGAEPVETFRGKTDFMLVYRSRKDVETMIPDFSLVGRVKARGIIVTAPGDSVKGRAFGSPLARGLYPRASTAEVDPQAKPGAPAAVDFVSRFFAPQVGIPEDPVTGSAHTTLAPYWAARLGKTELSALQLSKRGGRLRCRLAGERVEIAGQARTYLRGEIEVE